MEEMDITNKERVNEIINSTCEIINIPSVLEKSEKPSMPFGENCNKALTYNCKITYGRAKHH